MMMILAVLLAATQDEDARSFLGLDPAKGNAPARRWLDLAKDPPLAELQEVADFLYHGARDLNGFKDDTVSFLEDRPLKERPSWEAAARAHRLLVDRMALDARLRLARCRSVLGEWDAARDQYDAILQAKKAIQPNGTLDPKVVGADPTLLQTYFEYGEAQLAIGKQSGKGNPFDRAATVYSNILRLAPADTALWWFCKYRVLETHYERGAEADLRPRRPFEERERRDPVYDGGRFGMKSKFEALMEKIRKTRWER